jgi:hypothetical protein
VQIDLGDDTEYVKEVLATYGTFEGVTDRNTMTIKV